MSTRTRCAIPPHGREIRSPRFLRVSARMSLLILFIAAVTVTPPKAHPGDPVLVTVTGASSLPHGKAGGAPLAFYPTTGGGYQAVFAVPLEVNEDHVLVEVAGGPEPVSVPLADKAFPETSLVVEEDLANPSPEDGK